MHTIRDVAEHAGVAINTARKVLRADPTVRSYIRDRVQRSVAELDYRPNLIARGLRTESLLLVPIAVYELHQRFFGQLARDLSFRLVKAGYEPALCLDLPHLINLKRSLAPCAAILTGGFDHKGLRELSRTLKTIVIGRVETPLPNVGSVRMDFVPVYRTLVGLLRREGRSRVAYCSAALARALEYGWPPTGKFDALRNALRDAGLEPAGPPGSPAFASPEQVGAFLDKHRRAIDAVACENDHEASTLFGELTARGLRIPEDVRIVGCDANHMLRGTWSLALDTAELARHAVELLRELMDGSPRGATRVYTPGLVTWDGVPLNEIA